ncbi:hypothetical protein [Aeromicrobium chenweiae]|uniref:Uncharacterized protein n=1 Tax=Aeromicrobium chenweiae TaxID=2079793 RepID=A0A2S0WKU2_9ACTN|nr:hypothetical protein [Aeromicrobium chenweiae]AWB91969.1 hypothetical protein C3E78_07035 [Aeromicrobium chenweiae]TGN32819.1 hypothetical protein E4L97_09005 [Aeromicrobium chenweiae]
MDLDSEDTEPVGSIAQEAFKLFRAVTGASDETGTSEPTGHDHTGHDHTGSLPWCPVCHVVGLARDHPEAVASVTQSAAALARSLRDLVDTALAPQEKQ